MNILITNFHLKDGGGHKTYIRSILKKSLQIQNRFFLATPKNSSLYLDQLENKENILFDIEFPSKPREIFKIIKNIIKIKKIIIENKIDLVHVNGSPDHKLIAISKWLFRFDYRIIRTKHDSFKIKSNYFNSKLYSKYTDRIIVVSNYQLREVIPDSFKNKTLVIQNTVDLSFFYPRPKDINLMNKLGIKESDRVLISNAGTALHKGWQFIVKSVSLLPLEIRSNFKIVLLGKKPSNEILDKYVLKLGMGNNVIFAGHCDDVRPFIAIGDIGFVLSSSVETISYACREMMAMGKPVIVSNYAGLPENIDHKIDGWIVDVSDIKAISKILIDYKDRQLRKFSGYALERAKREFGDQQLVEKLMNVYN